MKEGAMRIAIFTTLATLSVLAWASLAAADGPAPDIKGKWSGRNSAIVAGHGGHWPSGTGSLDKPGLYQKDVTLEITGQEQRRFWGITTLSGNGEVTHEPFIGELTGPDGRKVVLVDTDGYFNGEIDGDLLTACYAQAGGPTQTSVVSCFELRHEH
jgi:hypothetical protein